VRSQLPKGTCEQAIVTCLLCRGKECSTLLLFWNIYYNWKDRWSKWSLYTSTYTLR